MSFSLLLRTGIAVVMLTLVVTSATAASNLERDLGRNEVRVFSAPLTLDIGQSILDLQLAARLERRGYRRVHQRPRRVGEFFWGNEIFWIFRRSHLWGRTQYPAQLVMLRLDPRSGRIEGVGLHAEDGSIERSLERAWLEPQLLSESLAERRAPRRIVAFEDLPEHLWRAFVAIEDERFFEHAGVDARGIARAAVANAKAGGVEQGGSTITQQLVKLRDLSAKRTFGRKVSEAVRALALEAEYSKEEILAAYLNSVYFGHVDGVSLYGVGAASQAFFSKPAERLDVGESALLAAIVQGPNRLSPERNPEAVVARQHLVFDRLQDLGWVDSESVARARSAGMPKLSLSSPRVGISRQTLRWIADGAAEVTPRRIADGHGVIVETTLDPFLQEAAERTVRQGLEGLRSEHRSLRGRDLNAALVLMKGGSGEVLAHVGGDPALRGDDFDRARHARRQPGSAIKPLVLLEALDECGHRRQLNLATRIADTPLTIDLPSGPWSPRNSDGAYRSVVDLRRAIVESLNVPTVRVARHCGFAAVAGRFRRAGLEVPREDPPPAFVLGAIETTPVAVAEAFSIFVTLGERLSPLVVKRVRQPSGEARGKGQLRRRRVSRATSAYLVRTVLADAVSEGTGSGAALAGVQVVGKTGTSSDRRDAWFVGEAGGFVAVVWVGMDDSSPLGLTGAQAALPLWRRFMEQVVASRTTFAVEAPKGLVELWIDPRTGRRLKTARPRAEKELFRRRAVPPRRRLIVAQSVLEPID